MFLDFYIDFSENPFRKFDLHKKKNQDKNENILMEKDEDAEMRRRRKKNQQYDT